MSGSSIESSRVALVREIIGELNRRNIDGVVSHLDRDFEWKALEASPVAGIYRGPEQVRRYVEDWLSTFDELRLDLEDLTEVGDHVVVVVRGYGRGRASGIEIDNRFCQVWSIRQGAATRMEEFATREEGLAAVRR